MVQGRGWGGVEGGILYHSKPENLRGHLPIRIISGEKKKPWIYISFWHCPFFKPVLTELF